MKKTDLYVTDQQITSLRTLSINTGLSVSEHIRRAIDEYLGKVAPQSNIVNSSNHNPVEITR